MFGMLAFAATAAAAIIGFMQSREFVRRKLRYVDASLNPFAPLIAGGGAFLIALPIVAFVPLIGAGTALLFGASVGFGVAAGQKDIRRSLPPGS